MLNPPVLSGEPRYFGIELMSEVKKLVVEPTHPLYLFFCWNHDLVKSCLGSADFSGW